MLKKLNHHKIIKKTTRNLTRKCFQLLGSLYYFLKNGQWPKHNKKKNKSKRKIKKAKQKAALLEHRLMSLGFTERALDDLIKMVNNTEKPHQRIPAAKVLARWYANQRSTEGALRCLEMLAILNKDKNKPKNIRRAAVMEAECHYLLGNTEAGRKAILQALTTGEDANLYLAMANFETCLADRIRWINKALSFYNLSPVSCDPTSDQKPYDCMKPVNTKQDIANSSIEGTPLITVIMPAYNSEVQIRTALNSMLTQTWSNLEVIVVDDHSSDNTTLIVNDYCNCDNRVRLIKANANRGPYVARNLALREAKGLFITCHDADDWSHPQKIETQAMHLLQNPSIIGNTSQQARVTPDMQIYRRGKYGKLIFKNVSSFMFRREEVMGAIGYWDCVRFSADNEYIQRVLTTFGNSSVEYLSTGPLSFTRQHKSSLTENNYFGVFGFFMGARKHYREIQYHYHENADNLYYDFPQKTRPFPVPMPMLTEDTSKKKYKRHFDIILASDFRLPGGTTMSNIEEINAQKKVGLRTGLVQLSRYDQNLELNINPKILDLLDGDKVQMIVYGESVTCDCLIVKHPPVLQERQIYIPEVDSKNIYVVINQTPKRDYGPEGRVVYNIKRCHKILEEYFGKDAKWIPISPLVRRTLHAHHAEELLDINLSQEDWVEIINIDEWKRPHRPNPGSKIRIGRHSRDHFLKWPPNPQELLSIYPDTDEYEIHILGGADAPQKMLGRLPNNWHVMPFGCIEPKDFLERLDIFVYFTHPNMVEAFGRVIIEAMAVGVPVILPFSFQNLFGDSALYAEPANVKEKIHRLMEDDSFYQLQVDKAQKYVEQNFGYQKHAQRIAT